MSRFAAWLKKVLPLPQEQREFLEYFAQFEPKNELDELGRLLRDGLIRQGHARVGVSQEISAEDSFPVFEIGTHDKEILALVESANRRSEEHLKILLFKEFSAKALSCISGFLAADIRDLESLKLAVTLQLFAEEKVHILILGNKDAVIDRVLIDAHDFAPVSSFGLGSGIDNAGLTAGSKGKEVTKGLLPLADKGVACIDRLNLIRKEEVEAFYTALEKDSVSYNKLGHNHRFEARTSVLATANPRYNTFLGKNAEQLKQEIPFDPALLTRFHIVFFLRHTDIAKPKKLGTKDKQFVKEYIAFAKQRKVELTPEAEDEVLAFVERTKKKEAKLLIQVGPRLTTALNKLVRACAAAELRSKAGRSDARRVIRMVEDSLALD
jgi:DNA replicative helicase MCM subunit Mcm2 (Cdc46/Mcm family)